MTANPKPIETNYTVCKGAHGMVANEDLNRNGEPMADDSDPNLNSDSFANFEWEYSMRRQMQEIIPNLWLGPYASALRTKTDELSRVGITHVICVRQQIESHWIKPNFSDKYEYLTLDIADTPTQNIIQHFPLVTHFIDNCLARGGAVLVHGNAGISRSAALVIAYIMDKQNLTANQAIRVVQSRRFCIFPNEGFRQQLQEYEPILQARGIPFYSDGGQKRPFSQTDESDVQSSTAMDT